LKEELLQFIWKYQLFDKSKLSTQGGEELEIISQGILNTDSGPDFSNSRIRVGNTFWAGNIEIHTYTSGWFLHKHHLDKAYQSTILHVVFENDLDTPTLSSIQIPHLVLKGRLDERLLKKYENIILSHLWIPCLENLHQVSGMTIRLWLERMLIERIEKRHLKIIETLRQNANNWPESLHQLLARNFGILANADAFERLARITPLNLLLWHNENIFQLEALLFGQSGMLEKKFCDDYPKKLQEEYRFLRNKYQLSPMEASEWKFARMRPSGFPTLRISQYADWIHKYANHFTKIFEVKGIKELYNYFQVSASTYWDTHFSFDSEPHKSCIKVLGKSSLNNILTNTVLPFTFSYGKENNLKAQQERAIRFFEQLPPEKNSITLKWDQLGFPNESASDSQALIQLKKHYCDARKCLECSIGVSILKKKY
jgi:hypothetical protein